MTDWLLMFRLSCSQSNLKAGCKWSQPELGMSKTGTTDPLSGHPLMIRPCSLVVHHPQHRCVCFLHTPCQISSRTKVCLWTSPGQTVEGHQNLLINKDFLIRVLKTWRDMWKSRAYHMSYSALLWSQWPLLALDFILWVRWRIWRRSECTCAQLYCEHSIIYKIFTGRQETAEQD